MVKVTWEGRFFKNHRQVAVASESREQSLWGQHYCPSKGSFFLCLLLLFLLLLCCCGGNQGPERVSGPYRDPQLGWNQPSL